jgi:tetratricopeptide (TPR) repeat protein
MTGRLIEEDPELAYEHAKAAVRTAARVASVREACGLAAYAAGHYAEALAELRAARRMSGSQTHLPVMADCERGLGRPERALALASGQDVALLDKAGQIEMRIVASGARRDMGQLDAAVLTLQTAELNDTRRRPWTARLRYAYADALLAVGRRDEAVVWFGRAADADDDNQTDADERLAELEGIAFVDAEVDEELPQWSVPDNGRDPQPVVGDTSQEPAVDEASVDPVSTEELSGASEAFDDAPADEAETVSAAQPAAPVYGAGLFQEPMLDFETDSAAQESREGDEDGPAAQSTGEGPA